MEHSGRLTHDLSGRESIGTLFDAFNRSLLILGEPGSGKTISLLMLAQERIALAESDPNQPVPVIFSLSTWTPKEPSLLAWLISEMAAKYSAPRKLSKHWLENQWIMPLLDGLDEVGEKHRSQCLAAINAFTKDVGVSGIAVCCRRAEYDRLPERLQANGAVCLQPLTETQIQQYLLGYGPKLTVLRTALEADDELLGLASSPLMLSVMCLAHADGTALRPSSTQIGDGLDRRHQLFDTYIDRMFLRRGKRDLATYSRDQVIHWLGFLATAMARHSQSDFLAEGLQPSWLATRRQRWLYLILSYLVSSIPLVILMGLLNLPNTSESYVVQFRVAVALIVYMIICGVLAGAQRHHLIRGLIVIGHTGSFWSILLNTIVYSVAFWFFIASMSFITGIAIRPLAVLDGFITGVWFCGIVFGTFLGLWGRHRSIHTDIKTYEALQWSGRKAKKCGLIGAGLALTYILLYWISYGWRNLFAEITSHNFVNYIVVHIVILGLFSAIGIICGGISTRKEMGHKTRFNQGMHLTQRNVLSIGLIFVCFGLLCGVIIRFTYLFFIPDEPTALGTHIIGGLIFGALLGLIVIYWFGGQDLAQHYVLRLLLSKNGKLPLRCHRFLRHGAALIFLQRVGGGYRFVHQMLREHFALKFTNAPPFPEPMVHQRQSKWLTGLSAALLFTFLVFSIIYSLYPPLRYRLGISIGDSGAALALAKHYENNGSNEDIATALALYRQAAAASVADAQFAVGRLYQNGKGVNADAQAAEEWYRRAAEQGHGQAQLHLALLFSERWDLPHHHPDVLKWIQSAAESGLPEAQHRLGELYHTVSTMQDDNEAEKWYRQAAAQGHINANGLLGWLLIKTGRWEEAQAFVQRAFDANPQHWYWVFSLGSIELLRGNKAEAEAFYRQALPLIDTNVRFQSALRDIDLFITSGWQPELCGEMRQLLQDEWSSRPPR
ncbi:MAG: NACHT domain-containing protein [Desulfosarcinaceae bacterium]|nr:NACHT domain-containing protein [Desulfosarcinaceae bacterium]